VTPRHGSAVTERIRDAASLKLGSQQELMNVLASTAASANTVVLRYGFSA